MGPTRGSEDRCSIRVVGLSSWEGCLHGNALGLHQIVVSDKSAILTPKSTPRPDFGKIRGVFKTSSSCTTEVETV